MTSFLGATSATPDVEQRENYWQLIGKSGRIIDDAINANGRVLVLFEDDLNELGLENHNPIQNSLWILLSDLTVED